MSNHLFEFASRLLRAGLHEVTERERRVIDLFVQRKSVSRNTNTEFDERLTFGQRVADMVATFGGSWTFIISFGVALAAWVVLNSLILSRTGQAFDPFPYILLNLILSMLASIQAPIIMMSQNRQAAKDRLDAAHDYEVNLKAELEVLQLHQKLDMLREQQWNELVTLQERQMILLEKLVIGHGMDPNVSGPGSDVY